MFLFSIQALERGYQIGSPFFVGLCWQKQNARLAAQAPEMYRVIREQYDQIVADSPHKSGEWCDFYNDVINIVREVEPHLFDVEPESRPDYTGLSF